MSLSGWRTVRFRSGFENLPSVDQLLKCWQNLGTGPSRSVSITAFDRLSAEGPDNGGPREPVQESAIQDKESPQATGDKRLWRKWIEERLAHSKAGGDDDEKFPTSGSSSMFEDEVAQSSLNADHVLDRDSPSFRTSSAEKCVASEEKSSSARSFEKTTYSSIQRTEEDVIAPLSTQFVKESTREFKSSAALDALISDNLKPSNFAGTSAGTNFSNVRYQFNRDSPRASFLQDKEPSSRSTTKQTYFFQEKTKRSSASPPVKQKATGTSPQSPMDIQLPKVEALDDFEYRVLGTASDMDDTRDDDFLRELDEIGRSIRGSREYDEGEEELGADGDEDWDEEKAQVLTDLALSNLEEFDLEDEERPYRLRADRLFFPGQTYDPEDLDISKPVAQLEKPTTRTRKNYSSKEVCQIADFRNPRYLSNFIRESSRILPRRHHQVSAKAQRRIAREIKTARVLGLMPFTSMGDPPFRFMRSRSDEDAYAASEDD